MIDVTFGGVRDREPLVAITEYMTARYGVKPVQDEDSDKEANRGK